MVGLRGLDLKSIGFYSLVGLPYIFKFLWAPLLDRYLPPLLGRRRGWIRDLSGCLAVVIGVMGFSSPTEAPYLLAAIALLVVFLSASQDIVIDAYRVDTIPPANAVSPLPPRPSATARHRCSRAACSCLLPRISVGTWLSGHRRDHGGDHAVHILGGGARRRRAPPKTLTDAVWHPLRDLISQKGAWGFLLLVLLYKAGDAFALSLYSAFMLKGVGSRWMN